MNKRTMTSTEARQEQENETNEVLLAEDAVQTLSLIHILSGR